MWHGDRFGAARTWLAGGGSATGRRQCGGVVFLERRGGGVAGARVGGGGAGAARIYRHTRTNIHLHVAHTRNSHARARTHGVGDALATMRNRSASVRIKVTTPPYSALYTGCFRRVTNRLTRTQSSIIHLPKIIGGYSVFIYTNRHRPRH